MPKSINSKKNEQHTNAAQTTVNASNSGFRPLKELNGQVLVSVDEFIANRKLIHGTPEEGFRLKDGREVIVATEIKGVAYPLERVADLLLFSLRSNILIRNSRDCNFFDRIQAESDTAKAFQIIWTIDDILGSDRKIKALEIAHRLNYITFLQLLDRESIEQLAEYGASEVREALDLPDFQVSDKRKIQFLDEYEDPQRLSNMIELGHRAIVASLEETDSKEDGIDLMCTEITGCFMVAQLRGMKRKATIEYSSNELGPYSKECVEAVLNMLTIDKEA